MKNIKSDIEKRQSIEEAIKIMSKIIDANPQCGFHYNAKADLLIKLDRYSEALAVYNKAISIHPNWQLFQERKKKLIKKIEVKNNNKK